MFDILTLQKELSAIALPSGFEGVTAEHLKKLAGPFCDEMVIDPLGSLICHKKGEGEKIMLCAHMDVIGFMVTYIDEKGCLRFEPIGGHKTAFLHRTPVRLENGLKGVIMCEKWAEESKKIMADIPVSAFYIDIGAGSYEKAKELVQIGDVAVFDSGTYSQNGCVITNYADDLVACIVLLKTMESLKESPYDLYFVFTVQEERGLYGAMTSAYTIHPDMGIALDVCGTGDTPSETAYCDVKLGMGPTVKVRDASLICNPQVVEFLRKGAEKAGVPYQNEIILSGATDAGAIQRTHGGILSGVVSIPTRHVHSPAEIYSLSDAENAVKLLLGALEK